jgi:PAS domain S-box-containing protein
MAERQEGDRLPVHFTNRAGAILIRAKMSKLLDLMRPFQLRLVWSILLPAVIVGFAFSILSTYLIAPPLISLLEYRMQADLKLASDLAMRICEERFHNLLEMRLEKDPKMIATARRESVNEIKSISKKFHEVHLLIIEDNRTLLGSSLEVSPRELPLPLPKKAHGNITDQSIGGEPVKMFYQYFPLWKWHIVSFTHDRDFLAPILLVKRMLFAGTFSIVTVLILAVFLVFRWRVNTPLNQIIMATRALAQGEYKTIKVTRRDEIAQVALAFNSMVGSLQQELLERQEADEALSENYLELQETTQRLEQSRNMLQLIIESIPARVFWKDKDSRFMGCNTLFARDAGLSQPEELIGKDDFAMGWAEQAEAYRADDRQVMESRRPKMNIVEPQTTSTGAKIWLNTSKVPLQMPNGEVFGVLGVYEDITPRYQAEESLRESEEKFRLVFEKAPLGIMHYDLTSAITDCNEKYVEIIGAPKEKFIGFNLMRQLRDDKMRGAVAASLKGEVGYYEGDYLSVAAGKLSPVRAIYQPIFSSDGVLSGGVAIFEDIGERKRAAEESLRFSKLESLGTLAGGIAHDFNNILAAILGNIGLAALDDKIGPRVKDRLAQAEAACLRAEALSRQLLTFAKGGAPVKKLFAVPELLTETTVFACVGSPVKCETTFPENLWSIEADPGQIGQVFQNLTINAIQAMPTGGTIKVWAENLTLGTESGLPLSAGRYIKISIRDQGIGIQEEHLPRIFDPYFTTKQKGSGLGLASAYAIVNKHHGHIAVESKPGVGTTFTIYLPASERQATPQAAEDRGLLVGTGKILVMDDEEMVRELLGNMLSHLGYEAEFARDGGEAIEMFVQAHGSGQAFAAVILDLTVPGAMGGKETLARLLEIDPQVKAVVSSGYSDDRIMADFQKYGFSGVIAKPYRISELGKILNQVIMKKA